MDAAQPCAATCLPDEHRPLDTAPATTYELEPVIAGETPLYSCHFPCASILVCRITNLEDVNFFLPANEQLLWLHKLHVQIDALLKPLRAEKVDLTGEILHFKSGTENEDDEHAATLVALAKELLRLSSRVKLPDGKPFQVRMGLHSGECMTSVVGSRALKQCVFGKAISIARELEGLSMPGVLRISADTRKLLGNEDCWRPGGSVTLPDWSKLDTFLLGSAEEIGARDLRSAHAALTEEGSQMGLLLNFRDQRLETPYVALHDSGRQRLDIAVYTICLALTAISVAGLALQGRIVFPTWLWTSGTDRPRGNGKEGVPLQLALGTILAWLTALGVSLLPLRQGPPPREVVRMLLRLVLCVHRVQSIYLALPGALKLLPQLSFLPDPEGAFLASQQPLSVTIRAPLVAILSLLLVLRLKKHVLVSLACLVLEAAQTLISSRQGGVQTSIGRHCLFSAIAFVLPTCALCVKERWSRSRFLATIRH